MTIANSNMQPMRGEQTGMKFRAGVVTGGGAATDCTLTTGMRGVTSWTYNAATGKYKIIFGSVGEYFLGAWFTVVSATGASTSYTVKVVSYTDTTKTLLVEVLDAATPSLHDLLTTEQVYCLFAWADSDAP